VPRSWPVVFLFLVLARSGTSQQPGSIELAALGVWHNKTTLIDGLRGFGGGARLGLWLPLDFALEGELDLTRPQNSVGARQRFNLVHYAGSLLYNLRIRNGSLYLRGGYGKLVPQSTCRVFALSCPRFGAATAALGFRIPMGSGGSLQLRSEGMIRTRPTYDYTSFGASLGLALLSDGGGGDRSGGDDDRDGVANRRDRCRDTPLGALVNSRGCPTDTDGDGVFDGIDRCPRTQPGTAVTPYGCPAAGTAWLRMGSAWRDPSEQLEDPALDLVADPAEALGGKLTRVGQVPVLARVGSYPGARVAAAHGHHAVPPAGSDLVDGLGSVGG
jgi:hypothetical protein